jgi:hypothetical protein
MNSAASRPRHFRLEVGSRGLFQGPDGKGPSAARQNLRFCSPPSPADHHKETRPLQLIDTSLTFGPPPDADRSAPAIAEISTTGAAASLGRWPPLTGMRDKGVQHGRRMRTRERRGGQ